MAIMRRGGVHRRRDEKGASAVEFALVLPVLFALLFGIIEFGAAFNAQISLTQAVREGVRVEALQTDQDPRDVTADVFQALGASLTRDDVQVPSSCDDDSGEDDRAVVEATLSYDPLAIDFLVPSQLTSKAEMRCGG